jgi:O-antigen/teichoic acid export membrane protein
VLTPPELSPVFETEHLQADLKGRSVRGGVLTLTSQGTQFLTQTVATVVLARLLAPSDFGLVAMVTAVTGLAGTFADLGLSEATIQRKEISHSQITALFWINVAIGVGLMLLTAAFAPALAWFYGEPRLTSIAIVSSLTFLIGGLRVQHDALLKRQMRFSSIAIRDVATYAVAVPAAITMAWQGAGYWSIVALPLLLQGTQMVLSWSMVNWRPGLPRRGADVGSMVGFGGKVAGFYVIHYVTRNADKVMIGWLWGAGPLGLYSRAHNLLMLPLRQLTIPLTAVLVPALSRLEGDDERFARYYLRIVNLTMWGWAPLFAFLGVAAEPVVVLMLGNQWRESAAVFQILAISAFAELLFSSVHWLLIGRGRSAEFLRIGLITSPFVVGGFLIGLPFGIKGVALFYALAMLIILPWVMRSAFRDTNLTLRRLGQHLLCPVSLCLGGALVAEVAVYVFTPDGILSQLLVIFLGFVAAYSLSALIPRVRQEGLVLLRGLLGEVRHFRQIT